MIDNRDHKTARSILKDTLAEFIASPCPHEDTRRALRPYLGGRKR